jgi:hypothetical protein
MKKITERQAKFLRSLLKQVEHPRSVDVDFLSAKEASRLISQLLGERRAQAKPPEPPPPPDDLSIPPELILFKRWAREVFQRGELTMKQLCALQDERFGKPVI